MKRLSLLLLSGLAVAAVAACGGGPKPEPPGPVTANTDSIAEAQRLEAERQAREAAAAKEREEAERRRQQAIADSLAAIGKTTDAVKTMLATMIHFDYDKAIIRGGDAAVLDQKVAILQANPGLRIRISGRCSVPCCDIVDFLQPVFTITGIGQQRSLAHTMRTDVYLIQLQVVHERLYDQGSSCQNAGTFQALLKTLCDLLRR